jgi:hypothetical protein
MKPKRVCKEQGAENLYPAYFLRCSNLLNKGRRLFRSYYNTKELLIILMIIYNNRWGAGVFITEPNPKN